VTRARIPLALAIPLLSACGRQPAPPERPHDPPALYVAPAAPVTAPAGTGAEAAAIDVERAITVAHLLAERGQDPAVLAEQGIAEQDWQALLAAVAADPATAARFAAAVGTALPGTTAEAPDAPAPPGEADAPGVATPAPDAAPVDPG